MTLFLRQNLLKLDFKENLTTYFMTFVHEFIFLYKLKNTQDMHLCQCKFEKYFTHRVNTRHNILSGISWNENILTGVHK